MECTNSQKLKINLVAAIIAASIFAVPAFAEAGATDAQISALSQLSALDTANNVGAPVRFEASGIKEGDAYILDFGDGTFEEGVAGSEKIISAVHKYSKSNYAGYDVSLRAEHRGISIKDVAVTEYVQTKVPVWISGDANGDGKVNIIDSTIVSMSKWNSKRGERGYRDTADLNNDGRINIIDYMLVNMNWGKTA